MIDHLHGDLAGLRPVAAGEIGMAHKETLAVVIRVNEPAGDIAGGKVAGDRVSGGCPAIGGAGQRNPR